MPTFDRYWKNPAHHRKEAFNRRRRLVALGLSHLQQLSPAARRLKLISSAKWRRTHLSANKAAAKRYRDKVIRLFGSSAPSNTYRHKMMKEAADLKIRKLLAKNVKANTYKEHLR